MDTVELPGRDFIYGIFSSTPYLLCSVFQKNYLALFQTLSRGELHRYHVYQNTLYFKFRVYNAIHERPWNLYNIFSLFIFNYTFV